MDAVAAAAGVTKRTLYNHFGDKARLFEAAIAEEGTRLRPPPAHPVSDRDGIRRRLHAVGVPLLEMLSSPRAHEFGRMMIGQVSRHSALISRFYAAGPATMLRDLANLIREATEAGRLAVPDPELAADQLVSMWLGQHHFRQQLGLSSSRTAEEIAAHVGACVEMFLRAYAPRRRRPR